MSTVSVLARYLVFIDDLNQWVIVFLAQWGRPRQGESWGAKLALPGWPARADGGLRQSSVHL